MNEFTNLLFEKTSKYLDTPNSYTLSESDQTEIDKLSKEKYSTWNWIFGYSPKYVFRNKLTLKDYSVKFELMVEKGIIKDYNLNQKEQVSEDITLIFNQLLQSRHDFNSLMKLFSNEEFLTTEVGLSVREFCNSLF